jgi:hypothetical protein
MIVAFGCLYLRGILFTSWNWNHEPGTPRAQTTRTHFFSHHITVYAEQKLVSDNSVER